MTMNLLETQDPEKRKLIETSERHKRELEKEVNQITERTERILTNALVIGGALALTWFLVSSLSGSKSKHKKSKPKQVSSENEEEEESDSLAVAFAPTLISQIGTKVINQATLILLDIAREKLKEYLHTGKEKHEDS
jgi:hypothetical protein